MSNQWKIKVTSKFWVFTVEFDIRDKQLLSVIAQLISLLCYGLYRYSHSNIVLVVS
jgi:hypothetical protein